MLEEAGVDYVHFCRTTQESIVLAEHNPAGLMSGLLEGDVPPYLVPAMPDLEDGAVTIYRVTP